MGSGKVFASCLDVNAKYEEQKKKDLMNVVVVVVVVVVVYKSKV